VVVWEGEGEGEGGAFAKLRKATISFVMSVRPKIWDNSTPNGEIFIKI
jgi:hypothetical protein